MVDIQMENVLGRIDQNTEAAIVGIGGVADILETHTEMLQMIGANQKELKQWLQEPPKSDLPDLLKRLTTAIELMQVQISALPEAIVRAVVHGELNGRG